MVRPPKCWVLLLLFGCRDKVPEIQFTPASSAVGVPCETDENCARGLVCTEGSNGRLGCYEPCEPGDGCKLYNQNACLTCLYGSFGEPHCEDVGCS
jgi:hypothetical protein